MVEWTNIHHQDLAAQNNFEAVSLMINAFMIANSADPDVRPHFLAFHLG